MGEDDVPAAPFVLVLEFRVQAMSQYRYHLASHLRAPCPPHTSMSAPLSHLGVPPSHMYVCPGSESEDFHAAPLTTGPGPGPVVRGLGPGPCALPAGAPE